jgi:hypothetical protein
MERRSKTPYFSYAVMCVLKVIEVVWSIDRKPLAFLYAVMCVLKIIEAIRSIDQEPLADLYVLVH